MYQYWLINCYKYPSLMQDVNNRRNWGEKKEGIWELTVLSIQFFCKPTTALKKSLFKQTKYTCTHTHTHTHTHTYTRGAFKKYRCLGPTPEILIWFVSSGACRFPQSSLRLKVTVSCQRAKNPPSLPSQDPSPSASLKKSTQAETSTPL